VLALSLTPAAAEAQLGPLPPVAPPPPSVPTTAKPKDDGLSTKLQLLIVAGAIALIAGIAWIIMRDARRAAPAPEHRSERTSSAPKLSARERERAKRQKRNKDKAARQQRKRNRSR